MTGRKPPGGGSRTEDVRRQRQAEALRSNLSKRKALQRVRSATGTSGDHHTGGEESAANAGEAHEG